MLLDIVTTHATKGPAQEEISLYWLQLQKDQSGAMGLPLMHPATQPATQPKNPSSE